MEPNVERARATEPALFSPEELAAYLGCGRTYVYELLKEGAIPSVKLGRLRKVRRTDADAFIEGLNGSAEHT